MSVQLGRTHIIEGSMKVRNKGVVRGVENAYDGVYSFFADRPLALQFNDTHFRLSPHCEAALPPDRVLTDRDRRLARILPLEFGNAAQADSHANTNDGLYCCAPNSGAIYAVVGGRRYDMTVAF